MKFWLVNNYPTDKDLTRRYSLRCQIEELDKRANLTRKELDAWNNCTFVEGRNIMLKYMAPGDSCEVYVAHESAKIGCLFFEESYDDIMRAVKSAEKHTTRGLVVGGD